MEREDYYRWAERAARWGAEYLATLEERSVRAQTAPGEIAAMLPATPPEEPVDMETIFADFERIVPVGMTHWQHRRFFAYFPANAAPASMIAENLTMERVGLGPDRPADPRGWQQLLRQERSGQEGWRRLSRFPLSSWTRSTGGRAGWA